MSSTCQNCHTDFLVTEEDLAFYDRVSPVIAGTKYPIPAPTHCPDCRQQRRIGILNERHYYSANCGLCEKKILSQYPRETHQPTYCRTCWFGDGWDSATYGQDVDFSRSFIEQVKELSRSVPAQNLLTEGTNINSEYIHYAGSAKNCYLINHADFCEDCYYGYGFKKNTACVDGFYNINSQYCYDCVDVHSCYGLKGCQDCVNCSSSAFLRDCTGCKNCFLCVGLRNKEYYFENRALSKVEYQAKMASIDLGSFTQYSSYKKQREEIEKDHVFKEFHGINLENCSGDYLQNCKNTHCSFDCENVEDGKYLYQIVLGAKNLYDIYQYGSGLQESYECSIAGTESYGAIFSHNVHSSSANVMYCWNVLSCKNCFGCAHMHNKQYCILNKQYTEEEYNVLVQKIIEHMKKSHEWGEFFPISFSPFGYNKTTAQLYYPLTREEAIHKGYSWDDVEEQFPHMPKSINANDLPDTIYEIPDDIINWAIICEVTQKSFRITKQELEFYRQQVLPVPHRSPDQRHLDRFAARNPRKFWSRECEKCQKKIETSYSPERPETMVCEECYLKEVY